MRYPIWKKDDFFGNGGKNSRIDMDVKAIEFDETKTYPLTWQYDASNIVGKVTQVRLEDGELTGEVEFFAGKELSDENMNAFDCRLGGSYGCAEMNKEGTVVLSCALQSVSVMFNSSAPGHKKG